MQSVGFNVDVLTVTPKQYHDYRILWISCEYGITFQAAKREYDCEAERMESNRQWINGVMQAAKDGRLIGALTLNKLEELGEGNILRLMHDYPDAKLPNGYQTLAARKIEKERKCHATTAN